MQNGSLSALGLPLETALEALTHCSGDSRALRLPPRWARRRSCSEQAGRFIEKDIRTIRDVARARQVNLGLLGIAASSVGGET